MIGQLAKGLLQLIGLVTLSRLLSPRDFGLVAMALVLVSLCEIFRDFGLFNAALQARTLDDRQRDKLLWINLGLGGLLAAVSAALAPLVASIYKEPSLSPLLIAISGLF